MVSTFTSTIPPSRILIVQDIGGHDVLLNFSETEMDSFEDDMYIRVQDIRQKIANLLDVPSLSLISLLTNDDDAKILDDAEKVNINNIYRYIIQFVSFSKNISWPDLNAQGVTACATYFFQKAYQDRAFDARPLTFPTIIKDLEWQSGDLEDTPRCVMNKYILRRQERFLDSSTEDIHPSCVLILALLFYITPELLESTEALPFIRNSEHALRFMSFEMQNHERTIFAVVKHNGLLLKYASDKMRDCYMVVFAAVQNDGLALKYASQRLRSSIDVIATAIQNDWLAIQFTSEEQQYSKFILLLAIDAFCDFNPKRPLHACFGLWNNHPLQYASMELQNSKEVVLAAVESSGYALRHASTTMKNSIEIVLAAVRNTGCALRFASSAMQKTKTVLIAAISEDGYAMHYIKPELRTPDIISLAKTHRNFDENIFNTYENNKAEWKEYYEWEEYIYARYVQDTVRRNATY